VYGVENCKDGLYACMVRIRDEKDIAYITEIVYDHVLFVRCAMCEASVCGKKISDKMPGDGAVTANPSVWLIILFTLVK
jgi:hypothetical protein